MSQPKPDPAALIAAGQPVPLSGNTTWAAAKAREVQNVLVRASEYAPRSQQIHLGPSEIGVACDRQIVGKLAGLARTNHVVDPWPSIVGTAVHAWLADAFEMDNARYPAGKRWHTERRVIPHPDHSGTADLYDEQDHALLDHKVLGPTSMAKVRSAGGPPRKYVAQLGLYGLGYMREGFPVKRVGLIAYPRTSSSLDGVYVWEAAMNEEMAALLHEVLYVDMPRRQGLAELVRQGLPWGLVPSRPEDDECFFCPFYRPDADQSNIGCLGTKQLKLES